MDTAIIRAKELGTAKASALGRTNGGGPIDAGAAIANFMGGNANSTKARLAREVHYAMEQRRALSLGGLSGAGGTATPKGTKETGVAAAAGQGASSGKLLKPCLENSKLIDSQVSQPLPLTERSP